jgi:hypothetical protein
MGEAREVTDRLMDAYMSHRGPPWDARLGSPVGRLLGEVDRLRGSRAWRRQEIELRSCWWPIPRRRARVTALGRRTRSARTSREAGAGSASGVRGRRSNGRSSCAPATATPAARWPVSARRGVRSGGSGAPAQAPPGCAELRSEPCSSGRRWRPSSPRSGVRAVGRPRTSRVGCGGCSRHTRRLHRPAWLDGPGLWLGQRAAWHPDAAAAVDGGTRHRRSAAVGMAARRWGTRARSTIARSFARASAASG